MKKLLLILLLLFIPTNAYTENKITVQGLAVKYNQAPQIIKQKYGLEKASFKMVNKDDRRDRIETKIGSEGDIFEPKMKISRWDDEVNFSAKLIDNQSGDAQTSFSNKKIVWKKGKIEANFYDITEGEGGYEFEVILKEKPATNKIEFTIQTKGLDFFYQPPLTQQYKNGYSEEFQKEIVVSETHVKDKDGFVLVERPENVVGSYAVYTSKQNTNWTGGKEYKTGKFGHIFRPKITDIEGNWVWEELDIDKEKGTLTITIPQDFLDKAVYPIRSKGVTLGYTTMGSAWIWRGTAGSLHGYPGTTDASGGEVSTVSVAAYRNPAQNFKGVITNSSKVIITNGVSNAGIIGATQYVWYTTNYSTRPTLSASTNYYVCIVQAGGISLAGDFVSGFGINDETNSYATPTDPTDAGGSSYKWSIYATYTRIKTINGLAMASVKTVNGLTIGSVKTWDGLP